MTANRPAGGAGALLVTLAVARRARAGDPPTRRRAAGREARRHWQPGASQRCPRLFNGCSLAGYRDRAVTACPVAVNFKLKPHGCARRPARRPGRDRAAGDSAGVGAGARRPGRAPTAAGAGAAIHGD